MKLQLTKEKRSELRTPAHKLYLLGGVLFTAATALAGYGLAGLPVLGWIGPMLLAIILAVVYRQLFDYPHVLSRGIDFSTKKLLRIAIVLYGFRLNIQTVVAEGMYLLLLGIAVIVFVLVIFRLLSRLLRADAKLSFLLAVGTGVCGAAAIAAVSPLLKAKDEDTAISVGLIALTGTVFALLGTLVYRAAGMDDAMFATWAGLSLHEIAHVVAAAAPAGNDSLALALLAKLGRVVLLVPLCFIIVLYFRYRRNSGGKSDGLASENEAAGQIPFPWFLLGFVATSLIGSYMPLKEHWIDGLTLLGSFLLTCAMAGLGLNVSFRAIYSKALKPLFILLIISALLSGAVLLVV